MESASTELVGSRFESLRGENPGSNPPGLKRKPGGRAMNIKPFVLPSLGVLICGGILALTQPLTRYKE